MRTLALTLTLTLAACGSPDGSPADASPDADAAVASDAAPLPVAHPLTPAELSAALAQKDFLLINVHTPDAGEIPGTDIHLPYTDVPAIAAYLGQDLGVKAVLYCRSNTMADLALQDLLPLGYTNLYYLDGGMNAWTAAGYPLE